MNAIRHFEAVLLVTLILAGLPSIASGDINTAPAATPAAPVLPAPQAA